MTETIPHFEVSAFCNDPYVRRIDKPWGWELHWTTPGLPYVGKVLHIQAGKRISLQLHDAKRESWLLVAGAANERMAGPAVPRVGRAATRALQPVGRLALLDVVAVIAPFGFRA